MGEETMSDKIREALKASECLYAWALSPNSQPVEKIVEKFQLVRDALTQQLLSQQPQSEPVEDGHRSWVNVCDGILADFDNLHTETLRAHIWTCRLAFEALGKKAASPQPAQVPEVTEYMLRAGRRALIASDEDIKECFLSMYDAYIAEKENNDE